MPPQPLFACALRIPSPSTFRSLDEDFVISRFYFEYSAASFWLCNREKTHTTGYGPTARIKRLETAVASSNSQEPSGTDELAVPTLFQSPGERLEAASIL